MGNGDGVNDEEAPCSVQPFGPVLIDAASIRITEQEIAAGYIERLRSKRKRRFRLVWNPTKPESGE